MSSFDFSEVYSGLKDFQRDTVEYVFQRMYLDDPPAHRFLVADEVGLGKTLVAKGLIARAAEHLDDLGIERIDIIYICSNAEIARQNIRRLSLPGFEEAAFASRLTLLPLKVQNLNLNRLNFVSFTPNTALNLKSSLGIADERGLLYWLLKRKWPDLVGNKTGPMRVFQGGVHTLDRFRNHIDYMRQTSLRTVDPSLEGRFSDALDQHDAGAASNGDGTFRGRYEDLAEMWTYKGAQNSDEARRVRDVFVGDLRNLLARTCIDALEPDLVILDEFQRFRQVLDGKSEAAELAHSLFDYSDGENQARVLLLSATPYKMYTLSDDSEEEDHYSDFLRTTKFLMDGDQGQFGDDLSEYGRRLMHLEPDDLEPLIAAKTRVETSLRQVMCRTERLASGVDRNGMLKEVANNNPLIEPDDLLNFVALDRVAIELKAPHPMEYWKSAPYFANFWDGYQIGRKYEKAQTDDPALAARVRSLLDDSSGLLSWSDFEKYRDIDPGNDRIRRLSADLLDQDAWKLLWLPPSLPYYELGGPFAGTEETNLTKRLVFSSWNVVPKVVSTLLSYEAQRRMMTSHRRANLSNSPEGRERFTEPLRFPTSKTSAMSAFAFIYPSPSLARLADPLVLARELRASGQTPTRSAVLGLAEKRIDAALQDAISRRAVEVAGPTDDRWYWAAALVLDADVESVEEAWMLKKDLYSSWTGPDVQSGAGFVSHVNQAVELFEEVREGRMEVGQPPDDLARVLALLAVGGPATSAYRTLRRAFGDQVSAKVELALRDSAARIAWGFRSLFNTPEVTQLIRGSYKKGPYWQRALTYCVDGCLQSVLDEYIFVLKEFEGIVGALKTEDLEKLGETVADIVSLRSSDLQAHDPLDGEDSVRYMRCRFALPFGQYRSEEDSNVRRSGFVRTAFNSPFWPFVLTTTSVGQEGLDFHLYCHAIVHWNLPANPVDLEQREGRIHRYMGHAVRKNLAERHGRAVLEGEAASPWVSLVDSAIAARPVEETDLVPFWVYPGRAQIERHVPLLPLSREESRLTDLIRSLAVYRLVVGQPRQEELVELLRRRFSEDEVKHLVGVLSVDLSPR